jgi:hypothetical protein
MSRPRKHKFDIRKIKRESNQGLGYTLKEVAKKLKYEYHPMNYWINQKYLKKISIDFLPRKKIKS